MVICFKVSTFASKGYTVSAMGKSKHAIKVTLTSLIIHESESSRSVVQELPALNEPYTVV